MKFLYDSTGGQQWKKAFPLYGAGTNIVAGAAVVRGTTAGTNQGFGIVAPANTSQSAGLFLGVTESLFAAATIDNDPSAGTKYLTTDLTINPHAVWEAAYDNASSAGTGTVLFYTNGLTITGVNTGTPSVTVTSLENISGGWLAFLTGSGSGQGVELRYVLSVSGGVATLKSATSANVVAGTTTAAKILPIFDPLLTLVTAADKIAIGTAAQGGVQATTLENGIRAPGYDNVLLDPTKHDGTVFPVQNGVIPTLFSHIQFTQHFMLSH